MNARRVNTAADVILAALTQNRTAAGIALALDSAQLLQSPESAVEFGRLRARVAELEEQLLALQAQQEALRGPDGITRRMAPVQALLDGEHYASTHHEYRVSRDLPGAGERP